MLGPACFFCCCHLFCFHDPIPTALSICLAAYPSLLGTGKCTRAACLTHFEYIPTQACLAWWNVVSPFGGFGSTAALAFVLIVAAVKAIFEDKKRHQEDHRTNKSTAHVVHADGQNPTYPGSRNLWLQCLLQTVQT